MAQQVVDKRDLDFVIWEQFENEKILENTEYADFNRKTCDMVLSEARKIALNEVLPTMAEGDKEGVKFENGEVKVPECFHRVFELLREGDWGNLSVPQEMGGQGAPSFLGAAVNEYFMGSNWPLNAYLAVGNGAAELIEKFGTEEQKQTYVKKVVSAQWGGTMLLTEPNAGSDVGALETTARKNEDGTYSLTGNKIFITNGEHDLCENIIHPVLARVEGSPPGVKGISIFIVPKYFVNKDGSLGDRNDIRCSGIEHKHGIKASATCSMALGAKSDCIGYLLGEVNQGMQIMFNMMNGARMGTGLQALSNASAAYLLAVNYARERIQGRELGQPHSAKPVAIINHPDVKRNLLRMKSYVEAMRSFFQYMNYLTEVKRFGETGEERQMGNDLFELLTPIIKSYLSNHAYDVCVQAVQVFGGAGYTQDYLAEQYMRDCKITSIYEGTCGIQAMDLLGRKIGMQSGKVFMTFISEIKKTVNEAEIIEGLQALAEKVKEMVDKLGEVAAHLGKNTKNEKYKVAFAHSLPFLDVMGDTIMAWMLLWRATVASRKLKENPRQKGITFYNGQLKSAEFFIKNEVPTSMGKMDTILGFSSAAVDIENDSFGGL